MPLKSEMQLVERLRKGANCVIFLDGAPEPAADVADMLRKAADTIEKQEALLVAATGGTLTDTQIEALRR